MEILPALQDNQVALLISQAIDKNVPVEALEKLLLMREKLKAEEARESFYSSMSEFQGECPIIPKSKKVYGQSGFLYAYAPVEYILSYGDPCIKELLKKHGFSYSMKSYVNFKEKYVEALCVVRHIRGHEESTSYPASFELEEKTRAMTMSKYITGIQTYAARYAFKNAFGIITGEVDHDNYVGRNVKETLVTEEEVMSIKELLDKSGFEKEGIYKEFKVQGLHELTLKQGSKVIDALKRYIEAQHRDPLT